VNYNFIMRIFAGLLVCITGLVGQEAPRGDVRYTQWGILDGNAVRTLYSNHAEVARWPDQPSGEWPKGSGHSYVDGVALIIAAATDDTTGRRIHPMSTNYREFIDRDPVEKTPWGWAPLPGYSNLRQSNPARSDEPFSWPDVWADQPSWSGEWNGFFGRGITNADVETYFVCDDSPDEEWFHASNVATGQGVFYPDPSDTTRGGLGMQIRGRGFQWSHVLAQDVIFWYYEISNESATDYDSVYFSQYIDWGIGGTADSGDDEGGFNTYLDIALSWDFNGIGQPGQWSPTGVAAYAFLESPGNPFDGIDNDDNGIVDERRDNPAGQWIDDPPNHGVADIDKFYEFYKRYPVPHFEGDEDQDWVGFSDDNLDGLWNAGEALNDDVGEDGLAPYHPNYPGPDWGEGDGEPTDGEPNFNATDKDESDQLGLTGFKVFNVHDYELTNDETDWRDIFTALTPPTDQFLGGGRNLGMFFSSGPFPMPAGHKERFSMALIFAEMDFPKNPTTNEIRNSALARKKEIVQQIYNADYRFSQPPLKPKLTAIPRDGQVILYWDARAEDSFDPFTKEYDFEGYKLYRSTEPFFNENRTITSTYGEKTFKAPLVQYDLNNEYSGLQPVDILGVKFDLGNNTGLKHFYFDDDVINGRTYYYALASYDRGLVGRDAQGNVYIDENGHARGLAPSECATVIKVDISQNIQVDINTASVTPRKKALGYIEGQIDEDIQSSWRIFTGPGTGEIDILTVEDDSLRSGHEYRLSFISDFAHDINPFPSVKLDNLTTGKTLIDTLSIELAEQELPVVEGLGITIFNEQEVDVIESLSGWGAETISNYDITIKKLIRGDDLWARYGDNVNAVTGEITNLRNVPYPADYTIFFENDTSKIDTSFQLGYPGGSSGRPAIPVPFRIWNETEQKWAEFGIVEKIRGDSTRYDFKWEPDEPIMILVGDSSGADVSYPGYKVAWVIRLFAPEDVSVSPIPPKAGDIINIVTSKPYRDGEEIRFNVVGAQNDEDAATQSLESVFVVPNPYVSTSIFEPSNVYKSGRGERRIYFMNLPQECKISIYTKYGKLVDEIEHGGVSGNGQEAWNLVSKDGMNIAYGIYFYVIEAYGEKVVGKFAIIK